MQAFRARLRLKDTNMKKKMPLYAWVEWLKSAPLTGSSQITGNIQLTMHAGDWAMLLAVAASRKQSIESVVSDLLHTEVINQFNDI